MTQKLCFLLLLLLITTLSFSAQYYFSESLGNDAWSGTLPVPNASSTDGPKRSIAALNTLLNTVARPGDSLLLRRGDLWTVTNGILANAAQGLPANLIVIGAYGIGAKPVIDKTGPGEVLLCRASNSAAASFLKFQNLALTSSSPYGSRPTGVIINEAFYSLRPHDIILDALDISNCLSGMILYQEKIIVENCHVALNGNQGTGHGIFSSANYIEFKNNVFDSNGCGNFFVHSLYISQCTDVLFENNVIKNADDGLKLRGSDNLIIRNNVIHDMHTHTIHVGGDEGGGTKNVIIEGNVLYNTPQGIEIKSESGIQTALSENIIIRNNILPAPIILSNTCPVKDVFIYNNLVYSSTAHNALMFFMTVNPINVQIKNNIFFNTRPNNSHILVNVVSSSGLSGVIMDHNLYYFPVASGILMRVNNINYSSLNNFRTAYPNQEINGQHGNPNFVNAPVDFHLTAMSALAIDKGADMSGLVDIDVEGRMRPVDGDGVSGAAYDIGPYEYCCFTTSSNDLIPKQDVLIYPNPTKDFITIETPFAGSTKIFLNDLQGKCLKEIQCNEKHLRIETADLIEGCYILQCAFSDQLISKKIVLLR